MNKQLFNEEQDFSIRRQAEEILGKAVKEINGHTYLRGYIFILQSIAKDIDKHIASENSKNDKLISAINRLNKNVKQLSDAVSGIFKTQQQLFDINRTLRERVELLHKDICKIERK